MVRLSNDALTEKFNHIKEQLGDIKSLLEKQNGRLGSAEDRIDRHATYWRLLLWITGSAALTALGWVKLGT